MTVEWWAPYWFPWLMAALMYVAAYCLRRRPRLALQVVAAGVLAMAFLNGLRAAVHGEPFGFLPFAFLLLVAYRARHLVAR